MFGFLIILGGLAVILYVLYLVARPKPVEPSLDELFKDKPVPLCGAANKNTHYEWEELIGASCPACAKIKEKRKKSEELDELAEKIVKHLDRRNMTVPKD